MLHLMDNIRTFASNSLVKVSDKALPVLISISWIVHRDRELDIIAPLTDSLK